MDPVWLDMICRKYYPKLKNTARRKVRNEQLAEDIVQSVFEVLLKHEQEARSSQNIESWLMAALNNLAKNELTRAYHIRETELKPEYEPSAPDPFAPGFLEAMPPGLSEEDRAVIYLHEEAGYRHKEIAAMMDCSEDTSRARLKRAKERCKKKMKDFFR